MFFWMFIGNRSVWRFASARIRIIGIFTVGAAKLIHEVWDHAMKVQSIVQPFIDQSDEITSGDRHFVRENLSVEAAHGCFKCCDWICHAFALTQTDAEDQGLRSCCHRTWQLRRHDLSPSNRFAPMPSHTLSGGPSGILSYCNADHLNGCLWPIVAVGFRRIDRTHNVHAAGDFSKNGML
jgi:hypothetical protein